MKFLDRHRAVPSYWWRGNDLLHRVDNWGDALASLLLERFAVVRTQWSPPGRATVISVGSVLEHVPPWFDGYILGTGKLYETSRLHLHTGTMTILALRGPLTARQCPPGDYAIGDPGLLASELVGPWPERTIDLGVVPHWADTGLARRPEWYSSAWTTKVIDPGWAPLDVITMISRCHKIVSSSLHGLIAADSFGIPRRFEPPPDPDGSQGGLFKYLDYSASIRAPLVPGAVMNVSELHVNDRKYELLDAYSDLRSLVRKAT